MLASQTVVLTDPDAFRAACPGARATLIVTGPGLFRAELTRIELERIVLLSCRESVPRIAHITLPSAFACVAFPTRESKPVILDGTNVQLGDVLFWGPGQRFHTRTTGAFDWGCILFKPKEVIRTYRANGADLNLPESGWVARPAKESRRRLLRLHRQADHAARTNPSLVCCKGPAGELERLMFEAAADCLAAGEERELRGSPRGHAEIMNRFEDILEANRDRRVSLSVALAAMGVSGRTLRVCCQQYLGVSPHRYFRLRRLNLARHALLNAAPDS
ncbi:MAG: AraC family transcriptional regulator, partial [Acetobacteraceae bacterium]|nr:AraC family transcriptional regulator [Acetobacteraceae bacterium]